MLSERTVAQPGRAGDVRKRTRLTPDVGRQKNSDEWTASSGAEMTSASHKALGLAYYQHVVVEGSFEEIPHNIGESSVDHNSPNDAPTGP